MEFGIVMSAASGVFGLKEVKKAKANHEKSVKAIFCEKKPDDTIIELVEKHYGQGKALAVADILNRED